MTDLVDPAPAGLRLLPLHRLDARPLVGVFTDIDDTLTTDGRLSAAAFGAIEALADAGIQVIPVTGRSAGWCDHIVRLWPVAAVIGETGAFAMVRERGVVRTLMMVSAADQARARDRRLQIASRVLREVPEAALAGDQSYRLIDLAIDIAEAVPRLGADHVTRIVNILREEGMNAQPSTIHVNGWFGQFDKGSSALRLLESHFGVSPDMARARWTCVGDAPNDAPLFAAFEHSVGVANLRRHLGRLSTLPRYITAAEHGAGFVELARHLLAAPRP